MTSLTPRTTSPLELLHRHRALAAVLAAALVVRLTGIGDWWLNPDEGIYFSILTRAEFGDFWNEVVENAHPPLYYLLLRGLGLLTGDFLWFRLFSVFCGLVAVAGVWAVAHRLAGGNTRGSVAGLVAGFTLAFAPGAVELSQVMRPYMLLLALLTWAFFFLLRHLARLDAETTPNAAGSAGPEGSEQLTAATDGDLIAYLTLGSLALLTHYSAVFALAVFGLLVLHDGAAHGTHRRGWRQLLMAHAAPAALLLALWLFHMRALSGSTLANEALDGWLRFYMVETPDDAWWSFLGFHRLVALPWLRGPMALGFLTAVGVAVAARDLRVAIAGAGALLLALTGAALGSYPFGATRHSVWLITFVVPITAGFVAMLLDGGRTARTRIRLALLALLLLFGGPVGTRLGVPSAPWAPTDRLLRQDDLRQAFALLDPSSGPELIVVSEQTFYMLMPLWSQEREQALLTPDGQAFHFAWGGRRVLASHAWDFTLQRDADAPGVHTVDGVFAAHLGRFLREAADAFPELQLDARGEALVVAGGWRPAFVGQLRALHEQVAPVIRQRYEAPGLYAFVVAVEPLAAVLAAQREPEAVQ